jgi:peptidoglycan/xylan/chitin deacetylase (PgdA/CDA1 family)
VSSLISADSTPESTRAVIAALDDVHPHGVMFHHFHDDARHRPSQGSIDADTLDRMLDFVRADRILPAHEWTRRAESGQLEPGDLCLTFDDALRCQLDVALPVLRARGLTAFWFVYTSVLAGVPEPLEIYRHFRSTAYPSIEAFYDEFTAAASRGRFGGAVRRALAGFDPAAFMAEFTIYTDDDRRFRFLRDDVLGPERYGEVMRSLMSSRGFDAGAVLDTLWMRDDDLRVLAAEGHVVGLHSHTHPTRLAELSVAAQRREYEENHAHLVRVLGAAPTSVSHPCNSYGAETLTVLRSLGVRVGFRANMMQDEYSELEHPREDHALILRRMRSA